eukprot:CAMPEP_0168259288 /NCGR_PEP_ID=MMETSP0141_2-20121125/7650_1 /TAXON_ID=44445 /ORGANISM="Pseudo-nitzschia australis, Strain 10249 10 AB" /LENGTH=601 /DNA_ID=CAMNT_0008196729 /DNA_START=135 /DNA_END=1941 /DNA_ORIENTATION=+
MRDRRRRHQRTTAKTKTTANQETKTMRRGEIGGNGNTNDDDDNDTNTAAPRADPMQDEEGAGFVGVVPVDGTVLLAATTEIETASSACWLRPLRWSVAECRSSIHAAEAFSTASSSPSRNSGSHSFAYTSASSRWPLAVAVRSGQQRTNNHRRRQQQQNNSNRNAFVFGGGGRGSSTSTSTSTPSSTRLHLFFNKRDEEGKIAAAKRRAERPTDEMLEELRSPGISFPRTIQLGASSSSSNSSSNGGGEKHKTTTSSSSSSSLVLRYMTTEDLKALVPMCINEFGSKTQQQQFEQQKGLKNLLPRWVHDPRQIPDLWEGFSFELMIYWTLRLKMMQGGNRDRSSGTISNLDNNLNNEHPRMVSNDPVMLVLCEQQQPSSSSSLSLSSSRAKNLRRKPKHDQAAATSINDNDNNTKEPLSTSSRVVGMVELSLQPPDADRNPSALPLPKWFRATLARHTTLDGSLQGWITNLLVCDSCRGRGHSKLLVAAVEGIAKHGWGCDSVYLHADADVVSGKIPQALYEGMGYEPVTGSTRKRRPSLSGSVRSIVMRGSTDKDDGAATTNPPQEEFSWAAGVGGKEFERFTAIRMVDGIALLCYSKKL